LPEGGGHGRLFELRSFYRVGAGIRGAACATPSIVPQQSRKIAT
jgi:hypothetical protein